MEYQKIINLLDNTNNQPPKFNTKNWVGVNDGVIGICNLNSQIEFKTTMIKPSLYDYSDVYLLVKGTITVVGQGADAVAIAANRNNKQVIFKDFAPFSGCISEIKNTKSDNGKDLDVAMSMYNLTKHSHNYSKTSEDLKRYWRYEPDDNITDSESFQFKSRFTNNIDNAATVNVEIAVSLKYLSNFCRTIEMPLIDCELTF